MMDEMFELETAWRMGFWRGFKWGVAAAVAVAVTARCLDWV